MGGAFELGHVTITYGRLWVSILTLIAFVGLLGALRLPDWWRCAAVTQNRAMASSMGIRTSRIARSPLLWGRALPASLGRTLANRRR